MTPSQQTALVSIIKAVADAAKDTAAAIQPGQTALGRLLAYENLIADIEAAAPALSGLSLAGLQPADYVTLADVLVTDLSLSNAKALTLAQSCIALASTIAGPVLTQVEAVIAAAKA
jgi:hypothetical protein